VNKISAVTTDDDWKIKFVADAEQVHKSAGIRGFSLFFNYAEKEEKVFAEHITGKPGDLKAFIDFAQNECSKGSLTNRYVLAPLDIELRLILNKDPKKNMAPQVMAALKIGSTFEPQKQAEISSQHFAVNVEMQQIPLAMKLLEYTGMYSKFQTGVLAEYQKNTFTEDEKSNYVKIYRNYLTLLRNNKEKDANSKRDELAKLEERFSLTAIRKIRIAERLEMDFDEKKEEAKKKTDELVKTMENQKTSTMTSFKSFFGSSTAKEEQKKAAEEVEKFRESLTKEQEEKLAKEREAVDKELSELFSTTAEIDIQTAIDMPPNYERFRFSLEINQITVALSQGFEFTRSDKMVELSILAVYVFFYYFLPFF